MYRASQILGESAYFSFSWGHQNLGMDSYKLLASGDVVYMYEIVDLV